jgi:hypothetical protein
MHVLKIIGIVIGSFWLYTFIGVHVVRHYLEERRGLKNDWEGVVILTAMWPIAPILEAFE